MGLRATRMRRAMRRNGRRDYEMMNVTLPHRRRCEKKNDIRPNGAVEALLSLAPSLYTPHARSFPLSLWPRTLSRVNKNSAAAVVQLVVVGTLRRLRRRTQKKKRERAKEAAAADPAAGTAELSLRYDRRVNACCVHYPAASAHGKEVNRAGRREWEQKNDSALEIETAGKRTQQRENETHPRRRSWSETDYWCCPQTACDASRRKERRLRSLAMQSGPVRLLDLFYLVVFHGPIHDPALFLARALGLSPLDAPDFCCEIVGLFLLHRYILSLDLFLYLFLSPSLACDHPLCARARILSLAHEPLRRAPNDERQKRRQQRQQHHLSLVLYHDLYLDPCLYHDHDRGAENARRLCVPAPSRCDWIFVLPRRNTAVVVMVIAVVDIVVVLLLLDRTAEHIEPRAGES